MFLPAFFVHPQLSVLLGVLLGKGHELQEVEAALSVRTAGGGAAGAAPRTRLVAVPDACGRFTCFPVPLQVLQFSPGLF